MSMRIHAFPPSPRAFKALVVANHVGADFELRLIDLTKGEQRQADYVAINPNMKMPALEDGDLKLWESNAILNYLAAKHPESGLLPADDRKRADVLRWQFWESTTWDPACAILVFERVVKPAFGGGAPDPVKVEEGLEKVRRAAAILDAQLDGRAFVCGDALTIADFSLGAVLTMKDLAQLPLEPYANIRSWAARLEALPAWQATSAMQRSAFEAAAA